MPRQKGDFDQREYVNRYMHENLIQKKLYFNRRNEEDMQLLDWANGHKNFSQYIKRLIWEDMTLKGSIFDKDS